MGLSIDGLFTQIRLSTSPSLCTLTMGTWRAGRSLVLKLLSAAGSGVNYLPSTHKVLGSIPSTMKIDR